MSGKAKPSTCKSLLSVLDGWNISKTKKDCIRVLCEKNIPKEPELFKPDKGTEDWTTTIISSKLGRCPNCGCLSNNLSDYCTDCGQALKWGD